MLASRTLATRACGLVSSRASLSTSSVGNRAPEKQQAGVPQQTDGASQTLPVKKPTGHVELEEIRPDRPSFYHEQVEFLDERIVRISKPTKNVMQSGTAYTHAWKIEFDSQPRDTYWLMGWTGTADPMSNMTMSFPTKERAIEYCEKQKLQWFVEEQPERKVRRKSYADNFSWDKRTRLGSK